MAPEIAKTIVENYKDAEILDFLDDYLRLIKRNLDDVENVEVGAGAAAVNADIAKTLLKAYREKKFGKKPTQVL